MSTINFESRECERIREQLDAYLSNELLVETTGEVLRHLENCDACSRELESRTRIRDALRKAAAKQLPPEGFREAVHQRLQETHPRVSWLPHVPAWALAACVLVVIAGVVGQQWLSLERGRRIIASVLALGVSDHVQCAIKGHNYPEVANPPDQLRKKLGPQYAGLLPVVEQRLPGYQVLEAHICTVPGSPRKYVHFIARGQGTILSVILTKRDGESLPSGRFLATRAPGGIDLYNAKLAGMGVAGFETHEYFGFVVSDLDQEDIVHLAASLAPGLRNALEGSPGAEKLAAPAVLIGAIVVRSDLPHLTEWRKGQ
jgi:anti-sigma factor (TIGR02949 family)